MDNSPRVCAVDGCDREVVARGWCRRHYSRWKRTGQLDARPWESQGACTVDDCDRAAWSGGLCEMHRWRVRYKGEPGPAEQIKQHPRKARLPCSVDGCERPRMSKLYCKMHYYRLRRTGELGPAQPTRARGVVKPNPGGYLRVHVGNGRRVLEHVHVMEQQLGRRLVPPENVHHKNLIRSDNDPSNLELWLTSQPSGARVTDLMEYIADYHADAMQRLLDSRKAG